ncbi:uncharacterized membrane-anchored protein YitT (DUF2179 family) [Mycoplasma testudineum]|uniref:Uncharacterized membrane-anchored protein YitT (DUF2179 family) n=1 Tax=Mycoplasma testudineum TaxID=244584 RepID=A0A4R6IE04_9MOLU|nr:YitT family protein [Mycoplasma testudineum]OYD26951.1 hypothetical protein CG473_01270 [Mycoplasma testudineum]TDO20500.1 uncharacterized membrane-anchored protein YitT (DUF2179 family) [Mycoplasma testudineum]
MHKNEDKTQAILNEINHEKSTLKNKIFSAFALIFRRQPQSVYYSKGLTSHDAEKLPWYELILLRKWSFLNIFLASFLFNIAILFFFTRAESLPSGVTGIPTLLIFVLPQLKPFFGLLFVGFNFPLLIYFMKKIKPSFIIFTWAYVLFSLLWSSILSVPEINIPLTNILDIASGWSINKIQANMYSQWPFLVYSAIGSILSAISVAILWRIGSSSAGTDLITYYISTKKKKPVGLISSMASFISVIIYFIVYVCIRWNATNESGVLVRQFFAIQLVSTLMSIILGGTIINLIYPKYRKVKVTIFTKNPKTVKLYLDKIKYWHSYGIEKFISGYTGEESYKISTVMLYFEYKFLIPDLHNFDASNWIKVTPVYSVFGQFDTSAID